MKRRVVVRPGARIKLTEATAWYRIKSPAVARAFRSVVRGTIRAISERPSSFPEIGPGIRRALTSQFPYAIFFAEEQATIVILSILHQAQDPQRWPRGS